MGKRKRDFKITDAMIQAATDVLNESLDVPTESNRALVRAMLEAAYVASYVDDGLERQQRKR